MIDTPLPPARWLAAANAVQNEIVALRREIHADPELGLQTPRTLAKVKAALRDR